MRRVGFLLIVFAFAGAIGWLWMAHFRLQRSIESLAQSQQRQFTEGIQKERVVIQEDLEEKYRADQVSLEALSRRLELEKKRVRELRERVEKGGGP